jgi:peptidoglycan/xylan/chitin deacetylase (PgdA/CDA1 family)
MDEFLYYVEQPDPRAEAVLAFVLESLGIPAGRAVPPALWERPHLVYGGPQAVRPNGVLIHRNPRDPFWPELLGGTFEPASLGGEIAFDVVGAIGAFLRDEVHHDLDPSAYDVHDRLNFAASAPARAGFGDIPVVNRYVEFIGRVLRGRLGMVGRPRWPDGRRAAIGLSHDVDLPNRYALLQSAVRPWRLRGGPRTYLRRTIELTARRARDRNPGDYWLFDRVMDSEAAHGFRSTFFFATVPFHARLGAPLDVAYDAGRREFRSVFRSIVDAGFEIGLHASYRAHEDASRLVAERARLSALTNREIAGVRHHYWHMGRDVEATLRSHERAGFVYDTSLAFNDHLGFRRSVALPFYPFDPLLGRPLRTVQLPTFCMDGNLFYVSSDVDAAVEAVGRMIDRIVEVGGLGVIDWHIQTSFPANDEFRAWGIAYQEILSLLAGRSDLWVTSPEAIAEWVGRATTESSAGSVGVARSDLGIAQR